MQKPISVMFIDDSETDRKNFEDAVKFIDESIQCILVEDGYSAMLYFSIPSVTLPDFIFLDINMRGMNGLECLHEIKKHPALKQIPVIMFTTSHVHTYEETAKLLGAKQCFTKSTLFEENVNLIASVILAEEQDAVSL